MGERKRRDTPDLCRGQLWWGDDGNVFYCRNCGYEYNRTRDAPYPLGHPGAHPRGGRE